jgi:hypothetical protein
MTTFIITPQGLTLLCMLLAWLGVACSILVIMCFKIFTLLHRIYLSGILTGRVS